MKAEEVAEIVISHGFNMTLTGGDPLMHPDLDELEKLVRLVRASGLKTWVLPDLLTNSSLRALNSALCFRCSMRLSTGRLLKVGVHLRSRSEALTISALFVRTD